MPRKVIAWVLSGVLFGLSFPPYNLTPLAWIALVPLLTLVGPGTGLSPRSRFLSAAGAGFIANLFIFEWLWPTFAAAKIGFPTTLACWILLAAILSVYFGVFALVYSSVRRPALRPWVAAAAWVALEEIRTVILTGFPWALASHTQVERTALIQIAAITGAPGLSFLVLAVNSAVAELARSMAERRPVRDTAVSLAVVCGLVGGTALWGGARLRNSGGLTEKTISVALLQGNIDQYRKWDQAYEADIRTVYGRLAATAGMGRPDLIVWPESAVPAWIPNDAFYTNWMVQIATTTGVPHLFGSLSASKKKEFNSAFVVHPNGRLEGRYDKRHLVPFGEYVPTGRFLKGVVPYIGQVGEFGAGDRQILFDIGGMKFAPNICYEMMFPALVRDSVREADVIVNVTNDGWFPSSGGPSQHFAVNILRAVENGRPVARAANTGISALIDGFGRVLVRSPLLVEGAFIGDLPVPPRDFRTVFGRAGNWFGWACCAASAMWVFFAFVPKRRAA